MSAAHLRAQASSTRTAELVNALDIALSEYARRYGNVNFRVADMRITDRGVEFTVTAIR